MAGLLTPERQAARRGSQEMMMKTCRLPLALGLLAITLLPFSAPAQTACAAGNPNPAVAVTTPASDFIDHGDGTVTHQPTGLMWKRCSQGQAWTGADCSSTASTFNWSAALAQAADDTFAGHGDWRLPNVNELESIVERCGVLPAVNLDVFPDTPSELFWPSSPLSASADDVWGVNFSNGSVRANDKSNDNAVRLVRAGQ